MVDFLYRRGEAAAFLDSPLLWEDQALHILADEEGFSARPYYCTGGKLTIGYGQRVSFLGRPLVDELLAAGGVDVGSDGEVLYMAERTARALLRRRISETAARLPWLPRCGIVRAVLVAVAYQVGVEGLNGFVKMRAAAIAEDWEGVAAELLDSKLARHDAPQRTARMAELIREHKRRVDADKERGFGHG